MLFTHRRFVVSLTSADSRDDVANSHWNLPSFLLFCHCFVSRHVFLYSAHMIHVIDPSLEFVQQFNRK